MSSEPFISRQTQSSRNKVKRRAWGKYTNLRTMLVVITLGITSVLMAFPFIWMVSASLKTPATVFSLPPDLWPHEFNFENYTDIINNPLVPFPQLFLNSIKVAVLVTVGQLITCTIAGYAFGRMRFPGRDLLFILLLTAVMVPGQVTIVPTFIILSHLNLIDTHGALIIPALTNIFGVFLLRQFFMTIPDELEDAARVDGASPFRILWQIIIPMSGPALSTLGILTFVASWNDFFGPFIFISTWSKMTWPLGLVALNAAASVGGFTSNVSIMMAGVTLAFIPAFVLFLFTQRYMIESITFTGIRG